MPETVEESLKECESDINRLKIHGMSAVVVIKILEALVSVIRTIALHQTAARMKKV